MNSKNFFYCGVLALAVVGCGGEEKSEAKKPATPAPQSPATPAGPVSVGQPAPQTAVSAPPPGSVALPPPGGVPAPGAAPAAAAQEVPSKDALEAVTHAVQSFFISKERAPKNLEELIASGFLKKLPEPPAGKKYVYDPEKANIALADK